MPEFTDLLFYGFAALTLLCGLLTVANPFSRSPVTSAMFLVLTIISMAGLFVLLHAFFLAAVQVLVYAGAVMVLFLFVIMLLDLQEEERRKLNRAAVGLGGIAVASLACVLVRAVLGAAPGAAATAAAAAGKLPEGNPKVLGELLFSQYVLPFEALSLLLLVAMVGVILLSKKDLK